MYIVTHKCPMVLNFSGGKDSTALALWALDTPATFPIDSVICFNTGLDWPQVEETQQIIFEKFRKRGVKVFNPDMRDYYKHQFGTCPETMTNKDIYIYYATEIPRKKTTFLTSGVSFDSGYGWPSSRCRWCTAAKRESIRRVLTAEYGKGEYVNVVGFAADELGRIVRGEQTRGNEIYPLEKAHLTERDCLQMCYDHGIRYRGLYDKITRASCYCCPLGRLEQHRLLYHDYPELWAQVLEIQSKMPGRWYCGKATADFLDRRFKLEDEHPDWSARKILQFLRENP